MRSFLLLSVAVALVAMSSCSRTTSSSDQLLVPEDFSSTWYYNNNRDLLRDFDPTDSLALVEHYLEVGKEMGLDYLDPTQIRSSSREDDHPQSSQKGESSSSQQIYSSTPPGTLPPEFRSEEYCFLNSDLQQAFSISNCASLSSEQKANLESHFVVAGSYESRWWNLQVQCTLREKAKEELPCDFSHFYYRLSCVKLTGDDRCSFSASETDSLEAHYFNIGKKKDVPYTNIPEAFEGAEYCRLNSDVKAIYGPTCGDQPLGWHFSLFGSKEGRPFQELVEEEDTQFDDYVPITSEPAFKVIGYAQGGNALTMWSENYMKSMSHVVLFGPEVSADGSIIWKNVDKAMLKYWGYWGSKIDTRVMVAFGGWCKSADFPTMAANPTARAKFIGELVELKDWYAYGVDIDWEGCDGNYQQPTSNVNVLLTEMKAALSKVGMKVSIALHATNPTGINAEGYNAVDWINVMCYDGQNHATAAKLNECMAGYAASYKSKAVMGHPFYYPAGANAKGFAQGGTGGLVNLAGVEQATNTIKSNGFSGFMAWSIEHDFMTDNRASESLMIKASKTAGYLK